MHATAIVVRGSAPQHAYNFKEKSMLISSNGLIIDTELPAKQIGREIREQYEFLAQHYRKKQCNATHLENKIVLSPQAELTKDWQAVDWEKLEADFFRHMKISPEDHLHYSTVHRDTNTPHLHISILAVNTRNERTIPNKNVGKKSAEACARVCKERGWKTSKEVGIDARAKIADAIYASAAESRSYNQFLPRLRRAGYELKITQNHEYRITGMRIIPMDKKYENPSPRQAATQQGYKLSEIPKSPNAKATFRVADIDVILERNRATYQAERAEAERQAAAAKAAKIEDFKEVIKNSIATKWEELTKEFEESGHKFYTYRKLDTGEYYSEIVHASDIGSTPEQRIALADTGYTIANLQHRLWLNQQEKERADKEAREIKAAKIEDIKRVIRNSIAMSWTELTQEFKASGHEFHIFRNPDTSELYGEIVHASDIGSTPEQRIALADTGYTIADLQRKLWLNQHEKELADIEAREVKAAKIEDFKQVIKKSIATNWEELRKEFKASGHELRLFRKLDSHELYSDIAHVSDIARTPKDRIALSDTGYTIADLLRRLELNQQEKEGKAEGDRKAEAAATKAARTSTQTTTYTGHTTIQISAPTADQNTGQHPMQATPPPEETVRLPAHTPADLPAEEQLPTVTESPQIAEKEEEKDKPKGRVWTPRECNELARLANYVGRKQQDDTYEKFQEKIFGGEIRDDNGPGFLFELGNIRNRYIIEDFEYELENFVKGWKDNSRENYIHRMEVRDNLLLFNDDFTEAYDMPSSYVEDFDLTFKNIDPNDRNLAKMKAEALTKYFGQPSEDYKSEALDKLKKLREAREHQDEQGQGMGYSR